MCIRSHPVQGWPEAARRKAIAVSLHGDEGTGKRCKNVLVMSISPLGCHREAQFQKYPFVVVWLHIVSLLNFAMLGNLGHFFSGPVRVVHNKCVTRLAFESRF